MIPISQSIEVDATVAAVSAAWPQFIEWVLVGPDRLACDELVCVDATKSGIVRFEEHPEGRAHVVFEVEFPRPEGVAGGEESTDGVEDKLRHDLLLFKDYVESREHAPEDAALDVALSTLRKEKQRGRPFHRKGRDTEPGLPARPSGQAR